MIELKNVSKFYNDNNVVTVGLRNVSLKLNKNEFVAITGDSGSGKSTLLNVISSVDVYDEGEILFYGNETFYFNQNDSDNFRKNNIAFIFQKYNIIDSYTVLQNVMLPLLIKGETESTAKIEALKIIEKVGLSHRVNNKGSNLSGGEKQRCVIARALATDAPILVCDEPTGNLDKKTSEEIINLIKEVSNDKLVLIVTHDYESIKNVCTRKIKLSDGEIIEDVIFKEGIVEDDKELNLKESKPKAKTLFNLAISNILSTPKKTIFTSLVFTFVCVVLLLLSLFMVQLSYEENYVYNDNYAIVSEDRMIVYADKHASIDMDKLNAVINDNEHYENAFYEEINCYFRIGDSFNTNGGITFHNLDYELIAGTNEVKEDEFVLVLPASYYSDIDTSCIGETVYITIFADTDYKLSIGKLVGIGIASDIYKSCFVSKSNPKLANIIINNAVNFKITSSKTNRTNIRKYYVKNAEKSYFMIPTNLKDYITFDFNLEGIYNVTYNLDVVYTDEVTSPSLIINDDYFNGNIEPIFDGVKEITIYSDNVNKLAKKITRIGYDVSVPSMVETNNGASLILLYLYSLIIIVALGIMFFISFAVVQRIYLTKTKDYSIFRTLGLVSKDLKKVLNIEIIVITLVALIFGFLITNLIILLSKTDLYKYESLILIILYITLMVVFAILTSNRLNKKIFKNSVYETLKEGGE